MASIVQTNGKIKDLSREGKDSKKKQMNKNQHVVHKSFFYDLMESSQSIIM